MAEGRPNSFLHGAAPFGSRAASHPITPLSREAPDASLEDTPAPRLHNIEQKAGKGGWLAGVGDYFTYKEFVL
jgi:hypothetical protein